MAFTRNAIAVNNISTQPNKPIITAAALKALFDKTGSDEKTYNNDVLLVELEATTNGDSGADNVGATALTGGVAVTVQGILEELDTKAVNGVAALNAHKTSSDHDGRYYTSQEIDDTVVKLTGNQTISDVKTFTSSPIVPTPILATEAANRGYVDSVSGGSVPDNSITNTKLGTDVKVGSLALLNTTVKTDVVSAINEVESTTNTRTIQNKIINGGFSVNQRLVSGTVILTAGQYGHDRFKSGASGCTYTFATSLNVTTLTISAGSLIQVIEGINLQSGTHVLSWTGTAQGKIGAGSYGSSGITGTAVGGTDLSIEFNTGTLSKVVFVEGDVAQEWKDENYSDVFFRCERYYRVKKSTASGARLFTGYLTSATSTALTIGNTCKGMRLATPTLTYSAFADFEISTGSTGHTVSAFTLSGSNSISVTNSSSTTGLVAQLRCNNSSAALYFDAEL